MKALRQEMAAQAASTALLHKFNSGASEPSGEVDRQRLLQGLAATQEVTPCLLKRRSHNYRAGVHDAMWSQQSKIFLKEVHKESSSFKVNASAQQHAEKSSD